MTADGSKYIGWLCYEGLTNNPKQIQSERIRLRTTNHEPTGYTAMETDTRGETLGYILYPNPEDSAHILQDLQLASSPSSSQVHERIKQTLLLPPQILPSHWLPSYQVLDGFRLSKSHS